MSRNLHNIDGQERKFKRDDITEELSKWSAITGHFEAETTWTNGKALDTNVRIEIKDIAITWSDRSKLMSELAEVLKRYLI